MRTRLEPFTNLRVFYTINSAIRPTKAGVNMTGTFQVGDISRAQKAQNIFWKKFEIFDFFCRKVAEIVKWGNLLDF